jgi:hypothetical protein
MTRPSASAQAIPQRAHRSRYLTALAFVLGISVSPLLAQSAPEIQVGQRLESALRRIQARGVRMVFSSELVTPDMRVLAVPRAGTALEQIAELLQPHGLVAERGPGGVIQIVRRKPATPARSGRALPASPAASANDHDQQAMPVGAIYREQVTVRAPANRANEVSAGIDRQFAADELDAFGGHIADDPLRTVQTLPGVATGDDFSSEYSVRGSAYRHAALVVDGVAAPWLQHAAWRRGEAGTVTMLGGDAVQEATLQVGAYPRVDGAQLGPQLNLVLREGSRVARRFTLSASGTTATATAEGPLGGAARGSWVIGIRNSHSEWPVGRQDEHGTVFGFTDLQSKVVYDLSRNQQVSLGVVAGVSNVERERVDTVAPGDGVNRAALATAAWRLVIGPHTLLTQRVSWVAQDFRNHNRTAAGARQDANSAVAWRVDLSRPWLGGLVDAGGQARHVCGSRYPAIAQTEVGAVPGWDIAASWLERAGYVAYRRAIGPAVILNAGLRLSDSTLISRHAVDRWLQADWSLGPRWRLHASTGVMHQFPAIEQLAGRTDPASLRPERASYFDVGIGQRLSANVRWDATVFTRRERDVLREADAYARPIDEVPHADRYENALSGSARGIELALGRRSKTGLSGWIGYSYGVARHTDSKRQETFAADFDQRHAVNLAAAATLPWQLRVGATFRGGTNMPIPGYLEARGGELFAGRERNRVRVPAYARLDARVERHFGHGPHVNAFVEMLNVLDRANSRPVAGAVMPGSGRAVGFTEQLYPRLLTAGVRVEF